MFGLVAITKLEDGEPPTICLPHIAVMPIAYIVEGWARLFGGDDPFVTVDGVRMARKTMFFSSAKAERELDYTYRSSAEAITEAVSWFLDNGYVT